MPARYGDNIAINAKLVTEVSDPQQSTATHRVMTFRSYQWIYDHY